MKRKASKAITKHLPLPSAESQRDRRKASHFALLGMLSIGERKSGYDLKKALATSTASFWSESFGNIYPALRRLLSEGLIREDNEGASLTGRPKQLYSITAAGKLALIEWLQKPTPVYPEDNEFLLKLFFGTMMPVGDAVALVEGHRDHHVRFLAELKMFEERIRQGSLSKQRKLYLQATVAYGQAVSNSLVDWANATARALKTFQSRSGK